MEKVKCWPCPECGGTLIKGVVDHETTLVVPGASQTWVLRIRVDYPAWHCRACGYATPVSEEVRAGLKKIKRRV